jgi:hypothetical protein
MFRGSRRIAAIALSLVFVVCPAQVSAGDAGGQVKELDGLWSGAWGGGQRDGVVFQPVIAEMFIKENHVELKGFPNVGKLAGTIRIEVATKRLRITPSTPAGQPAANEIEFAYEIKGNNLTLSGNGTPSIGFGRRRVVQQPLANAQVELVAATGINDAGDLLVTEITELRAGQGNVTYFQPEERKLSTKLATVFQVQEAGMKKVTVDEARKLIGDATPVAITYRQDDRPMPQQWHELWKNTGTPAPDSEVVRRTFARLLRPGTLLFVLSARENAVQP